MNAKLLLVIAWLALAGAVLIVTALQMMRLIPAWEGLLVVVAFGLLAAWAAIRSKRG